MLTIHSLICPPATKFITVVSAIVFAYIVIVLSTYASSEATTFCLTLTKTKQSFLDVLAVYDTVNHVAFSSRKLY